MKLRGCKHRMRWLAGRVVRRPDGQPVDRTDWTRCERCGHVEREAVFYVPSSGQPKRPPWVKPPSTVPSEP